MAADSGYHSFSLPRVPRVGGTSETSERSNAFDLQESADDLTASEVQAIVHTGDPKCLFESSETPTSPQPAAAPITLTTVNRARGSDAADFSRQANAISRFDAFTEASLFSKVNISRKRDDGNDHEIPSILEPTDLEAALAQHFRIAVNMTKHMNDALFHPDTKDGITQPVMVEVRGLAEEMIYFFDGLQGSFKIQIEEVNDTTSYLPILGDNVEEHHLATAIHIWAKRICENVRKPRKSEERLLHSVARAYDASVYGPFLQLRRRDAGHNIRELSVHLDSVYNAIEGAVELYEQIILDVHGFRQALEGAFDAFRRSPYTWSDRWGYGRVPVKAPRHIAKAAPPSVPSTPTASTDAESDDKAGPSTMTPLQGKALKRMARAARMKRKDT